MPHNECFSVAARYVPMTAVAGDFFDFLIVDERRLGVLIADVSGHGVPAALIASMVKIAIAAQLPHAHDPALVLAGLNHSLAGNFKGQFVTAAYLFLDAERGTAACSSAGHPPILLARNGKVLPLGTKGLALGLRAASQYPAIQQSILPGDRFLLYTDGLFEARNAKGDFYGEDRIHQSLAASVGTAPDPFAAALVEDLSAWAGYGRGGTQEDDLTLVIVEVTALPKVSLQE